MSFLKTGDVFRDAIRCQIRIIDPFRVSAILMHFACSRYRIVTSLFSHRANLNSLLQANNFAELRRFNFPIVCFAVIERREIEISVN